MVIHPTLVGADGFEDWVSFKETLINSGLSLEIPDLEEGFDRDYALQDIDRNGTFEVLETIPYFEDGLEFMNVELAPALEWITIYRLSNGKYIEATEDFTWFLGKRKAHYELWLKLVENPEMLSRDSKGLIDSNRAEFINVLRGYIAKIEGYGVQ